MERYVYVEKIPSKFERRLVKVGISDFFFAEIQDGLEEGEVVSLELPKEERGKKPAEVVRKGPPASATKPALASSTNAPSPGATPPTPTTTSTNNQRSTMSGSTRAPSIASKLLVAPALN